MGAVPKVQGLTLTVDISGYFVLPREDEVAHILRFLDVESSE